MASSNQNYHLELQLDDTLEGEGALQRSDSHSSDISLHDHSCTSDDSSNPESPKPTSTQNGQDECLLTPSPTPTASLTEDDSNTSIEPIKPTGAIKTQPKKRVSLNTTASMLNDAYAGNTKLPEYTAMRECYPQVINFVKETPGTITDALFSKGYISSAVCDLVRMECKPPADQARVLVDKVMDRIKFNPEIYHDFVEILEKEGICANHVTQDLRKTYRAKSSCASASDPHSPTITGSTDSSPPVDVDEGPQESAGGSSSTTANDAHHHGIKDGFICPFCKKCSVNVFFSKKGCPQAVSGDIEQQNMFPYLNTKALSELDKQELEAKLLQDTDTIVLRFAKFELAIIKSFESHKLDVELVLHFILSLRNHSSLSPMVFAAEVEAKLNEFTSIRKIFSALRPCTSFFDYTILQQIIKEFGTPDDQERLETYVAAFGQFCKRNVFEIPRNMFYQQLRDENGKVFSFKYNTEQIPTFGKVIKVRQSIADILNVSVWILQLCSIEKGCVCLRFWIPLGVADEIFPVSEEKEAALLEISIEVLDHGEANFLRRFPQPTSSPSQSSATPLMLEEPPSQYSSVSSVLVPSHGVVPSTVTSLPSKVLCTVQSLESGTPLSADCDNHPETVQSLIEKGADPKIFVRDLQNAIDQLTSLNTMKAELQQKLLETTSDVDKAQLQDEIKRIEKIPTTVSEAEWWKVALGMTTKYTASDSSILIEEIPYFIENLGHPEKYFEAFKRAGILSPAKLEAIKSQQSIELTIEHFIRTAAESDNSYSVLWTELRRQKVNVRIARHLSNRLKAKKRAMNSAQDTPRPTDLSIGISHDSQPRQTHPPHYHGDMAAMRPPPSPEDQPSQFRDSSSMPDGPDSRTSPATSCLSNVRYPNCGVRAQPSQFDMTRDSNGVPITQQREGEVSVSRDWVCTHCWNNNLSCHTTCQRCGLFLAFSEEKHVDGPDFTCTRCGLHVSVQSNIPKKISSVLNKNQICYKCYRYQMSNRGNYPSPFSTTSSQSSFNHVGSDVSSTSEGSNHSTMSANGPTRLSKTQDTPRPTDLSIGISHDSQPRETHPPRYRGDYIAAMRPPSPEDQPSQFRDSSSMPDGKPRMKELHVLRHPCRDERVRIIQTIAPNWTAFGDLLDFDDNGSRLKLIQATSPHDGPAEWCREMFAFWLEGKARVQPTWENLISLLEDAGQGTLAGQVKTLISIPL